jgi:hypothetical protein
MSPLIVKVIVILALPTVAFTGGVWLMFEMSGRERVTQSLAAKAEPADRKPLYQRLTYDVHAVKRHWGAMDGGALHSERRFLQLDLVFPFLYGAALPFSLIMAWETLGRRFHPAWVLTPVLIAMLSDCAENLIQLRQLSYYMVGGDTVLQAGWIRAAGIATLLKLLTFGGSCLALILLVGFMLVCAFKYSQGDV